MDLKLDRPGGTCAVTGRPLAPGEVFYSALVRGGEGLERIDCSATAWTGPPAGALAWWRSTQPHALSSGPALAPTDVLLDVLEELEGKPDDAAFRYLLALQLVRRRVLRILDPPADQPAGAELLLACRKRDREYRVAVAAAADVAAEGVGDRLTALLWSGEAA
jgi:hypothetical protein